MDIPDLVHLASCEAHKGYTNIQPTHKYKLKNTYTHPNSPRGPPEGIRLRPSFCLTAMTWNGCKGLWDR
eukprot:8631718-Heterocapsa_arctica.AAC.1